MEPTWDRAALIAAIARLIHRKAGHVDDHATSGDDSGGCYRAAEGVVELLPADGVTPAELRLKVETVEAEVESLRAERDAAVAEQERLRQWANRACAEEQREKFKAQDLAQQWLTEHLKSSKERDEARAQLATVTAALEEIAKRYCGCFADAKAKRALDAIRATPSPGATACGTCGGSGRVWETKETRLPSGVVEVREGREPCPDCGAGTGTGGRT